MSARAWCLVCNWWTRLSACHRDVSWHCAVLERKLHWVNEAFMVFWNAQNVSSRTYNLLMHCRWWLPMSRTWCANAAVIEIEYHWRSRGQECVGIAYCVLVIRSYCQNTSRSPFLLSMQMWSHHRALVSQVPWQRPRGTIGVHGPGNCPTTLTSTSDITYQTLFVSNSIYLCLVLPCDFYY